MTDRRDLWLALLLVTMALLRGLFWIGLYPAFKIVDEPAHFDDVQFRAEHSLHAPPQPLGSVDRVQSSTTSRESKDLWAATQKYWRSRFLRERMDVPEEHDLARLLYVANAPITDGQSMAARNPGFYYELGAAIPYRIFRHTNVMRRLFALRVYTLLWGTLFVLFAFCAARVALRDRTVAFTVAFFVMLQPLVAQETVGVSPDAAVFALCTLVFWAQLVIVTREADAPALGWWLTIAIASALALDTKPTAIAILPGTMVLVARALAASRSTAKAIAVSALVFGATWLVCSLACDHVVNGDAIASKGSLPRAVLPVDQGFFGFAWHLDAKYFDELTTTGWTTLAWLETKMTRTWIDDLHTSALLLWLAIPAAAALRWLFPDRPRFFADRAVALSAFTVLAAIGTVVHAEYVARLDLHTKHSVSGRELLVALPALACVGAAAIGSLVPRRFRMLVCGLACLGVALLAAGTAMTIIGSMYVD